MSPDTASSKTRMLPPPTGVKVRMYDVGFGDCFLLAFPTEAGGVFYMLIDCGVHNKFKGGSDQIKKVVKDIAAATDSHLNLVAITHEHTDHLLGFNYAQSLFGEITIDDLWLAWTEDPADPLANSLKERYGRKLSALAAAVQKLKQAGAPMALNLENILQFEMPAGPAAAGAAGKIEELEFLRRQSHKKLASSKDYRRPGEPALSLPGVNGVKFIVLGPPKNEQAIKDLEDKDELYLGNVNAPGPTTLTAALADAPDRSDDEEKGVFQRSCPFDESFRTDPTHEKLSTETDRGFFKKYYGFKDAQDQGPAWRRIDTDWLAAADELALWIDSYTNNTSLVLALELSRGKVLLFAGDAQVGNWMSWYDKPPQKDGPGQDAVNTEDLLRRTALYKVGHHGSWNATLKEKGLKKMTNAQLVAMLPVDQEWAKTVMHWEHPDPKILQDLEQKTLGRIIRMDAIPAGPKAPPKPDGTSPKVWKEFIHDLNWDRKDGLWIEYTVHDEPPETP